MGRKDEFNYEFLNDIGLNYFRQRLPWIGGDLQTLRDTFRAEELPVETAKSIRIPVEELPGGSLGSGYLLALLDLPPEKESIRGLVLMIHGLGGSSKRAGLRRMAILLQSSGFAVLRLNLRGADPGRHLAGGTYAAQCNSDLKQVFVIARDLCRSLEMNTFIPKSSVPLLGVGISLGGTILLNACLEKCNQNDRGKNLLDGLVCTSSPLDLLESSLSIERARNSIYQRWLLKRLIRQTLSDPFGISPAEKQSLVNTYKGNGPPKTIREFDSTITAPRWGYESVDSYYERASPLVHLSENHSLMPPTLILQSLDDPWVPVDGARKLSLKLAKYSESKVKVLLTKKGGHNGFHGVDGCWGDQLVVKWFNYLGY